MEKISYKGKIDLVREKRKENPRLVEKESGIDYIFHMAFQQDFYESMIIIKTKPAPISQWIDWTNIEAKHDVVFDEVVTACRAKHLRDAISFQKNWKNEIIAQFYATLYVEERGDTRNFIGWPKEGGMRSPLSSLLGSLDLDGMTQTTSKFTLHPALVVAGWDSCTLAAKEGVLELLQTCFPSMPTWIIFFRGRWLLGNAIAQTFPPTTRIF
jgi:hypothetical protein